MHKHILYLTSITLLAAACALSAQTGDYKVGSGDTVEIKFFYNPELNQEMQVRPDGKLSLPLVGELTLAGRTVAQIESDLKERYAGQLARPEVNVAVKSFASQRVFVGGEVNKPSAIPLQGEMTAREAILDAGGAKKTGALSKVVLIRRGDNGQPVVQILNMADPQPPANTVAALPALQPFDVVLVPETKIARVDRWVDQYIRQVLPVTLAGGFSYLIQPIP